MSKQTINIGASPNDGTGTPLRTSFDYTNQNFTEIYTALGGGVALPGATTQVIFNDGGTNLAGDAGLVYNKTTDALTIAGPVNAASATITGDLTAARLIVTGGTIPTNGLWLATTNTLEFATNSLAQYRIAPLGVFSWFDGAGGTRMTLNSTGLGVGVTPSAGRGAIQLSAGVGFPATQVASSDANTLDDYEEGTWTGTLKGSVSDPTTPVTTTGRYTKIGRMVHVSVNFANVSTVGASGNISISGLPFASANDGVGSIGAVGFYLSGTFTGSPASSIIPNSSVIDFFWSQSNGVNGNVTHNAGAGRYINTTLVYYV